MMTPVSINTFLALGLLGINPTLASMTTMTTSIGTAPYPTASADSISPPNRTSLDEGNYVFTIVNSHTAAVSTSHAEGFGSPTAIQQGANDGMLEPQETVSFAAPTGWTGRMSMWEKDYSDILDRASLLEGSFINDANGHAVIAIDVSYVDGFTVPMVCECNNTVVLGCNLDLHDVCPKDLQLNAKTCKNPYREDIKPPGDVNIFKECEKMAYTYPTDDLATKVDIPGCTRQITCCIGTACKHHPGQQLCPASTSKTQPCAAPAAP